MSEKKMEGIKIIANAYKVIRPLFQVRSYLYAQICCLKNKYSIINAALFVYENDDPSQSLKMLSEKLGISDKIEYSNLIFPFHHIKDSFNDKQISLFFIKDYLIPLRFYEKKPLTIKQSLQFLHGALSCLNQMHTRDVVHGNISLMTCYLIRQQIEQKCKFAFNILDTVYFTEEENYQGIQERLFESEGQSLGMKVSYKDDLESLVYVLTHLISKGRLFTIHRFQLQWITQSQFLRWKSCDFFKEMIKIIPHQLQILIQIYTIAKSLRRNQKPDYIKLIKKVLSTISNLNSKTKAQQKQINKVKQDQKQKIREDQILVRIQNLPNKNSNDLERKTNERRQKPQTIIRQSIRRN